MTHIKYVGRSDARVLDAADLAKGDVEGFRKTVFQRNIPVEVDEAAAEAILRVPEIYGRFEVVEATQQDAGSTKGKAKAEATTETAAASTSTTPATRPSGRASTGS